MRLSVQSEINRISGNVTAALEAIAAKGVSVGSGSNSDDLATLIAAIEAGGGGNGLNNVYSGTVTPVDAKAAITIDSGYDGLTFPKFVVIVENLVINAKIADRYSTNIAYSIRTCDDGEFVWGNNAYGSSYVGSVYKSSTSNTTSVSHSGSSVLSTNFITDNRTSAYNMISFRNSSNPWEITFTTGAQGSSSYGLRPGITYYWIAIY